MSPTSSISRSIALALSLAAILAAPATATTEVEPNNDAPTANGPIVGDGVVEGTVGTGDEHDFYLVNVAPNTQLSLTVGALVATEDNSGCVVAELSTLLGDSSLVSGSNDTDDEDYSTAAYSTGPSPLRALLDVRPCYSSGSGTTYKVTLAPGAALSATPGQTPIVPHNPEPNETRETANGPLAPGTTYQGQIDTVNDLDWFKVWVPSGSHQISLQQFEYDGDINATWYQDASTTSLGVTNPDDLEWATKDVTVTGPTTIYAQVKGRSYPLAYGLRVEPADPLGVTTDLNVFNPPPPPDRTAPVVSVSRVGATMSRFRVFFTTNEPGNLVFRLYRRGALVRTTTGTVDKASTWTSRIPLSATDRRKIRKARRRGGRVPFRIEVTQTDAAGNTSSPAVWSFRF